MAANRNYVKKNLIASDLQKRIQDLRGGGSEINGSLSVLGGHDYWWFLEYGTGERRDASEQSTDGFEQPSATLGESPEGAAYEITIKNRPLLVYMTKGGVRRRAETVEHPGLFPIGFVRISVYFAEIYLKTMLTKREKRKKKWKELPDRAECIEIVNRTLEHLLKELKRNTPDDNDPDPYHDGRNPVHLADAWRITKAK